MSKTSIPTKFIPVKKNNQHINALYKILKNRKFNISNNSIPSFSEHKLFVINNPYREWFLIEVNKSFVGSLYLMNDNCIGVHVIDQDERIIRKSIEWVLENKKPLPEIKSVRVSNFHINLPPNNITFTKIIESMGATSIQSTFLFK
jgi:hypothetical protein